MGIKAIDLYPPVGGPGFTPITPPGQTEKFKITPVTRAMTVATLIAAIPAQSSIISVGFLGSISSNAATSATVTITVTNNAGTILTSNAYDVKNNGAVNGPLAVPNLPNLEGQPLLGDLRIYATYAETGTASTVGGPWNIRISYC